MSSITPTTRAVCTSTFFKNPVMQQQFSKLAELNSYLTGVESAEKKLESLVFNEENFRKMQQTVERIKQTQTSDFERYQDTSQVGK